MGVLDWCGGTVKVGQLSELPPCALRLGDPADPGQSSGSGSVLSSVPASPRLRLCHVSLLTLSCWFPGVIRTAVADLDRETQDRYEVVIRATDMAGQLGGLSGSTTVTIVVTDVNDNPPRFPQSKSWQQRGVSAAARPGPGRLWVVRPPSTACLQGELARLLVLLAGR